MMAVLEETIDTLLPVSEAIEAVESALSFKTGNTPVVCYQFRKRVLTTPLQLPQKNPGQLPLMRFRSIVHECDTTCIGINARSSEYFQKVSK